MKYLCLTTLFCFICVALIAQNDTSNYGSAIVGKIIDRESETELIGATIELLNFMPRKTALSDTIGFYQLDNIPIGRYRILVSKEGYENVVITDLVVNAGQFLLQDVELEQVIIQNEKIKPSIGSLNKTSKDQPYNQMSGIASRPFTVEEVTRYAGSRFDLARLATNFAGVSNNYDARNDIVVRGNSPAYLTWQLEELPIENPNHLITNGTAGGTTPIINIFALGKADFMKGCFAAQYGNSIAGIFDLHLRKGNPNKMGLLAQVGTQRVEVLWEGGLNKKKKDASFLLSVRGSVGNFLFEALGNTVKDTATKQIISDWADPQHQDINVKIDLGKYRWGELEFFGIGGLSKIFIPYDKGALRDKIRYTIFDYEDFLLSSVVGVAGAKHTYHFKGNIFWRNIVGVSYHASKVIWNLNQIDSTGTHLYTDALSRDKRINYLLHSYIQAKLKSNLALRVGITANVYDLSIWQQYQYENRFDAKFRGAFVLAKAYAQTRWAISNKISLFGGVNAQYLSFTKQFVAEPRLSLNWQFNSRHTLALGYGMHHQMPSLQVMFYTPVSSRDSLDNPTYDYSGYSLKFNSSQQVDLEYRFAINENWRFKLATYAQFLSSVPIEQNPSPFSVINTGATFFDAYYNSIRTGGKGRNMGIELTLEKYFSNGFYGLLTSSVFDSKYQGSDGVWRNTVFNNRYIFNFLLGREWKFGKFRQNALFTDIRFVTKGGKPYTPIDTARTINEGYQEGGISEFFFDSLTYARRTPAFYQVDLKFGVRINNFKKKITHIIRIDLFNAFNFKNVFTYRFNAVLNPFSGKPENGHVVPIYERGFIPDITYSIQF